MGDLHSRVPQVLQLLSHGDAAVIMETCLRLDDVDQDDLARIPKQQYQNDYYRYRGLRA
jgi:hypothetical protein